MTYVALLRGINVGGNRKVEMARLKLMFEQLGFGNVKTFIASGNVIFHSNATNPADLTEKIEDAIQKEFGFKVDVLLRDLPAIKNIFESLPEKWVNDKSMKCDVLFLWDAADSPKSLKLIPHNPEIEDLRYVPGAIIWRIDREHATKSRVPKIIGTPFYKQLTIRNANTVRKIYDLMARTD